MNDEQMMMNAHLFLARADDHRPVLADGVPILTTLNAPLVVAPKLPAERLVNIFAPPDDLREQRWALVVPKGDRGQRLLSLIKSLRTKREEEQQGEALVYEVPPDMDQVAAARWIKDDYRNAVKRKEAARPRYLLLLGGPEDISWDFQQMLAGEAFVGRLAFDHEAHYEAYADKVVRHADARDVPKAQALFHTVLDHSKATEEGHAHLMQPTLDMAHEAMGAGGFDAAAILDTAMKSPGTRYDLPDAAQALLKAAASARASLLFTMSHGAGTPKGGAWPSVAEQRAGQGAVVLGTSERLACVDVGDKPFVPQGVWFLFACYGAGTPRRSAYASWVQEINNCGMPSASLEELRRALPRADERPFVAALPQAALANPHGPLAVVGHVDLAWAWSFMESDPIANAAEPISRAYRFQSILRAFIDGHRFGVAHHELVQHCRSLNAELTARYDEEAHGPKADARPRDIRFDRLRKAHVWMQRNDLSAYVLLGDPAARLPIARRPAGIRVASAGAMSLRDEPIHRERLALRQEAVRIYLHGHASVDEIAKARGVSQAEVQRWINVYCEAGREALKADLLG